MDSSSFTAQRTLVTVLSLGGLSFSIAAMRTTMTECAIFTRLSIRSARARSAWEFVGA